MPNWYASREAVKRALDVEGPTRDRVVDMMIGAASREIERELNRRFIPITKRYEYPYPQKDGDPSGRRLFVDDDLLAVTLLTKRGDDEVAIASGDFLLEPVNFGPPYFYIDIAVAGTAFFEANANTYQRAIRVTGRWGFGEDTEAAGAVVGTDINDLTTKVFTCSDGGLIDIGDSILIGSELLFVKQRDTLDSDANTTATVDDKGNVVAIPCDDLSKVLPRETIQIGSERMLVESRAATSGAGDLTVKRAFDGSVLEAHSSGADIFTFRRLTVNARGGNGSTAATHADASAISRYVVPEGVGNACLALAEFYYQHGGAGWTGELGSGDQVSESRGTLIRGLIRINAGQYGRQLIGSVSGIGDR